MRRLKISLVAGLLALGAASLAGVLWFQSYLERPLGAAAEGYVLQIPEGRALGAVLRSLASDGILDHPDALSGYARLRGLAERIQAGEYELSASLSPQALLGMLVGGRVKLHSFTIVEGWTVRDLLAAIRAEPTLRHTLAATSPEELAAELALPRPHAEGLFLPETYRHPRGMTDRDLLLKAHELLLDRLGRAWSRRAPGLPLENEYQALTLASLIERETALETERPQISGVFVRRLQRGMRLQTDPSVIYGIGPGFNGDLTRRDLRRDTPYNTYTREGLPPTPIALAGVASLRAAVDPAPGDSLYFVATGLPDGSHDFTATLEEHNAAVARYLARLRLQRNGG